MTTSRELGRRGEELAAHYLERAGYHVLETNWRCAEGEADIIAVDREAGDLVIVEVKTRRGHAAGHPFAAVTPDKLRRLRRLAVAWKSTHAVVQRGLRVDVVGVTVWPDGSEIIEHLEGVTP